MYEAQQGLARLKNYLSALDVLILNKDEAVALTGKRDTKEALNVLKQHVSRIVVITNGSQPIQAYDGREMYIQNVPRVQIVSTAGAGDAFAAGFITALVKEKPLSEALNWGIKNSQSVLRHVGAHTGLLRRI